MSTDEDAKKVTIAALISGAEAGAEGASGASKRVRVSGLLRNEGKSYFHDLRLVLVDEEGAKIAVAPWLPLEPIAPPAGSSMPWPHAMSEFLDKHVSLTGIWQKTEAGRILRVTSGDVTTPPLRRLTREEVQSVGTTAGAGLAGLGVLHGEIHVRDHRIALVTEHLGSMSEVCFVTDLPEHKVRALEGKRVAITGVIRKLSPWAGTITRAHIVRYPERHAMPGEYLALSGLITHKPQSGSLGEALPAGTWLVLREPLHVGRLLVKEVHLMSAWYPDGKSMEVFGRLVVRHYGGAETSQHPYVVLSGVSSMTAKEPIFDGIQFRSADGLSGLSALVIERRDVLDKPNEILVLDPQQGLVHAGTLGGYHPHELSPFGGFFASAPIVTPTDAEKDAVVFDEMGDAVLRDGQELLRVLGREGPTHAHPDALASAYWFDDHNYTLYKVVSSPEGKFPFVEWIAHIPHHALVAPNA